MNLKGSLIIVAVTALIILCNLTLAHSQTYLFDGMMLSRAMSEFREGQTGRRHDQVRAGLFLGYVAGMVDAFEGVDFVIPEGVALTDIAAVVCNYMVANPDEWGNPADVIVRDALSAEYPIQTTGIKVKIPIMQSIVTQERVK